MKKLYIFLLPIALLLSASVSAETVTINQVNNTFSPMGVQVEVGDVIHFVWGGGTHTTTSTSVPVGADTWDAPLTSQNPSFDYTVTVAGLYGYECSFHNGMVGGFQAVTPSLIANINVSAADFTAGVDYNNHVLHVNVNNFYPSHTVMTMIDITGKEVGELFNMELGAGEKSFQFEVSDRTPGIYFIRLEQNGKVVTRRVLLN